MSEIREKLIKKRRFRRKFIFYTLISLGVLAVLLYIFIWGNFGLLRIYELEEESNEIEAEIKTLKAENEELRIKLGSDEEIKDLVEKREREEKGYLREDEILFKFIEKDEE